MREHTEEDEKSVGEKQGWQWQRWKIYQAKAGNERDMGSAEDWLCKDKVGNQ